MKASIRKRLAEAKTERGFAGALGDWLRAEIGQIDCGLAGDVFVMTPKESAECWGGLYDCSGMDCWTVGVEGGPFDWAIYVSSGGGVWDRKAPLNLHRINPRFYLECMNGFTLSVARR